jgi:hypothetical protein
LSLVVPSVEYEAKYSTKGHRDQRPLSVGVTANPASVLGDPAHDDVRSGMNAAEVGEDVENASWMTDD